jgi:hypothetical protein
LECGCQFFEQIRDVIVEGRCVKILRSGDVPYVATPLFEQALAFLPDERCQLIK